MEELYSLLPVNISTVYAHHSCCAVGMAASASGTDVCVYCMTACTVEQLIGFCMKGISPLVA